MGASLLPGILVVALLAVTLRVFVFSPLSSPERLALPDVSPHFASIPINTGLHGTVKLGVGLQGPEDVCIDEDGVLYTATRDGWIKRLRKGESAWEDWVFVHNSSILGIAASRHGGLVVCDTEKGLLIVHEGGASLLSSHVGKSPIRFADDVIEALDGNIYFSVASTKYTLSNWFFDVLEARPYGQLLKYDPSTKESTILLDNLAFANGVALSKDEDFLVVCETWKFRCIKYWLKGEKAGETEVFIENLPGGPDNINLAPDGSFWIALLQLTIQGREFFHTSKVPKHVIATFPSLISKVTQVFGRASVMHVGADGNVLMRHDDPQGKVCRMVTSAVEHDGHLYLGSLRNDFVGKLPLV
ncbi:hypothetical protein MLD38_015390 [Melastoma candidum]|uniref:Uncharacterized protein n=1 Tax=Melastoma candidum TaxID=119954 RepID=A0ACB9RHV0_9MYRT|nr:hypothetical protein MLD38_015390 [Melastoma candidum]